MSNDSPPPESEQLAWLVEENAALREVAEAAKGVMTQMDYETPHHTRLRAALEALEDG